MAEPQSPASGPEAKTEYGRWISQFDTLTAQHRSTIADAIGKLANPPMVSVIMTGNGSNLGPAKERNRTLASLRAQLYPHWEALIAIGTDQPNADLDQVRNLATTSFNGALNAARGHYVVFVEAGDILPPQALATMILAAPGGACLVYSDEDEIDPDGKRQNPYFKSSWNPDLFLSQDYACRLAMVRTADARDKGRGMPGRRAVYDLLLQVTSGLPESTIIRLPHVLYHRRAGLKLSTVESQLMRRSVEEHIRALPRRPGFPAPAVVNVAPGLHHVDWGLPLVPPRVSVIIPTRDRVDLLRTCVDGLRFDTDYPDLEIIIADNGSVEADTLAYLKSLSRDQRVRIISHGGTFNYSAINNAAAHHATGDLIALLNNDLAIHESGWLRDMASHAMRPGVGAVGAMLWYGDGTVQHAGVRLGVGGVASHTFKRHKPDSEGYHGRMMLTQDLSAVTAACMLVPREAWEKTGGLDETFAIAYNDIDFCLRIRKAGYRIIWTPRARLYHLESASRGREDNPEKVKRLNAEKSRMQNRWKGMIDDDPFFNPNLSLTSTDCRLAFPPRAQYPWAEADVNSSGITVNG